MKRLEGKVAIVTGGALGIGEATCRVFANEGAKVIITDILDNEGKMLEEEIRSSGGEAEYFHIDTSNENEVKTVLDSVFEKYGALNVLVNNAGISGVSKPTHEVTSDEWDKVMNINVKGVFFCTKYAIPYLKQSGSGSIINLSSIYGLVGAPDAPPYHASKGAVRLMTKTDALFYAPDNIRVNSVHPGFIWTPMVEAFSNSAEDPKAAREYLISLHPLGRLGKAEEVANCILFLASEDSSFMTGSELVVDGGYTCR